MGALEGQVFPSVVGCVARGCLLGGWWSGQREESQSDGGEEVPPDSRPCSKPEPQWLFERVDRKTPVNFVFTSATIADSDVPMSYVMLWLSIIASP